MKTSLQFNVRTWQSSTSYSVGNLSFRLRLSCDVRVEKNKTCSPARLSTYICTNIRKKKIYNSLTLFTCVCVGWLEKLQTALQKIVELNSVINKQTCTEYLRLLYFYIKPIFSRLFFVVLAVETAVLPPVCPHHVTRCSFCWSLSLSLVSFPFSSIPFTLAPPPQRCSEKVSSAKKKNQAATATTTGCHNQLFSLTHSLAEQSWLVRVIDWPGVVVVAIGGQTQSIKEATPK